MIWRSPLWMPLAWEIVAVQFGYIGLRLWERFGKTGLLMIGLLGAINIPFYEEMARRIHWWQYSSRRMISYTPWYIIIGEFGIALVFALLAGTLRRDSWRVAIVAGVAGGASIFVCYRCVPDYRPTHQVIERGIIISASYRFIVACCDRNRVCAWADGPSHWRFTRMRFSDGSEREATRHPLCCARCGTGESGRG
jgi:hypothetical protein